MQLTYAASAGDVCGIMPFLQIRGGFYFFIFEREGLLFWTFVL